MAVKAVRDSTATHYGMFIDGAPAESVSGDWTDVRSPATGELVARVPAGTRDRGAQFPAAPCQSFA